MQEQVRQWLEQETVDVFIGCIRRYGHTLPHVFSRDNLQDCEALVPGRHRYPLEKFALDLSRAHPEWTIGLLARDCNTRALNVLTAWNQMEAERIRTLELNCCPSPLGSRSDCSYLQPETGGSGKQAFGLDPNLSLEAAEALSPEEQARRWSYEFSKCIKCYGCRNICPVCFCRECSLEHPELIHTGQQLTEVPLFHLVRAAHMAGRCIDCGLCEQACPMDIPLRLLYRKVNAVVEATFGYQAGASADMPPLSTLEQAPGLEPQPLQAAASSG